jgi:CheY-like chemotaxis protein
MANVLVIDDDASVRKSIKRVLNLEKHTFFEAQDGQNSLDVLLELHNNDSTPHIIFCDYNMPHANGYDFCLALKTKPEYQHVAHIPILGIGDFPNNKRDYLVDCYQKPFGLQPILDAIQNYALK